MFLKEYIEFDILLNLILGMPFHKIQPNFDPLAGLGLVTHDILNSTSSSPSSPASTATKSTSDESSLNQEELDSELINDESAQGMNGFFIFQNCNIVDLY